MNSSQKRKLTWIIIGIIVLLLFISLTPKRKDLKFSPLRIISPGLYPTSPESMIPNNDDSWTQKILDRMRTPKGPVVIVPAQQQWQDNCDSSTNGWTNCIQEGPRFYGTTCSCSEGSCSWSNRKLCDSDGCISGNPGSCQGEFES